MIQGRHIMANEARIIRTLGFTPAHDADAILAAAETGLDAVGPDLEDLTPKADKQRARDIFRDVAKELAGRGVTVMPRVNSFEDGCEADLDAIVCPELHCVNIPKATSAEQVIRFCQLLEKAESNNGLPVGQILVRPVVETAAGIRAAYEVASASDRVEYMGGVAGGFWGDLGATLGAITGPDGMESFYIRSKVIVDVRSAGLRFPIGGGSIASNDLDSIREFAWQTRRLGYTGHFTRPSKDIVEVINEVYTPTKQEIEEWTEVLPALEQAKSDGKVAFMIGDKMYDTAGLPRVKELLSLARRLGLVT
jgi:citrate lyase subunit beta/citryl-CoA lyase